MACSFLFLLLVDLILARLPVEALVGLFEERNMVVELHEIKIARDVELTVVLPNDVLSSSIVPRTQL